MNEALLASYKARIMLIETDVYSLIKYDYTGGPLLYTGRNTNPDAADDATNWRITKHTYVENNWTEAKTKTGKWSDRTTLLP